MATSTRILIESRMHDALEGDASACFDLGIAHSCGTMAEMNLVEAHKWFELAALGGYGPADKYRADVARGMTLREVAEARRRLRRLERPQIREVARCSASLFA